ncbi:YTH domain-containing family protein isoform X1 [Stomoxys calcitrans]|uniref:YTH domain-containing family protein isoform X1 n=1 Tax=Stomoxys calcitrans TaxID=35570 RepID=UPI0027E2A1C7|nr:YTH domain-containing family protein isoform X1 [Stomoxys calcitrans]
MSSGVSDQMKIPGNTGKNADRNVPWIPHEDEASAYENLASPINEDNSSAANQNSSMQFQYPPFNAKEAQQSSFNNYKSRKSSAPSSSSNYDSNKKFNKPAFYNNKKDDHHPVAWGSNSRKGATLESSSGNYAKGSRYDENYGAEKLDNRSNATGVSEEKKSASVAPKKTTWASIASQPAKLTSRTTLTTSSHKKKGPGMPPPPMVPGKHNLDANIWDMPNNNPPPVPSPPPPIDLGASELKSDFSPVMGTDFEIGSRSENAGQNRAPDSVRDENKSNYGNNFGRVRNSPNGHSRKNWSTQHPLHPHQSGRQPGHNRHGDGKLGGGGGSGNVAGSIDGSTTGSGRYGDRRPHYPTSRQESASTDYQDENAPKMIEANNYSRPVESPQAVLEELRDKNNYNPAEFDLENAASARFFVIKSYSEDDIHRSIKYEIWCSTDHGNKRLDDAFKERHKDGGNILLFFSVNGSGHFCGMAQMMTPVDYNSTSSVWSQDKWKGKFKVKWIYVKDVPNNKLRHITLENNENKPVTNSRDTQEVPNAKGIEVLQILHSYKHTTSIFDDFYHYEKKQEEEVSSKKPLGSYDGPPARPHYNSRQNDDRDRDRDRDGRSGGGLPPKYFGSSFRERNNSYRSGSFNSYNDHRRFDSYRSGDRSEFRETEADRENNEYNNSSRHMPKYDYSRRTDDRASSKHSNRERDFPEEQHAKNDSSRIRSGARETQKDNEYSSTDRIRGNDY